jgi:hypothetical protein
MASPLSILRLHLLEVLVHSIAQRRGYEDALSMHRHLERGIVSELLALVDAIRMRYCEGRKASTMMCFDTPTSHVLSLTIKVTCVSDSGTESPPSSRDLQVLQGLLTDIASEPTSCATVANTEL